MICVQGVVACAISSEREREGKRRPTGRSSSRRRCKKEMQDMNKKTNKRKKKEEERNEPSVSCSFTRVCASAQGRRQKKRWLEEKLCVCGEGYYGTRMIVVTAPSICIGSFRCKSVIITRPRTHYARNVRLFFVHSLDKSGILGRH